jgi:hypothetical protein
MRTRVTPRQGPKLPAPAEWTPPIVECCETRPVVTAYAGEGGPWNNR